MRQHNPAFKADNCPRENKNNTILNWMSFVTGTCKMRLTSLNFGRVGHTHGPLGIPDAHTTVIAFNTVN